ncbi:TAXI family TRAP transporter solute-binding subunit [Janthinobacterium lividum]|uniref:TAXI family TRAP transporter solute-binding subunit n=1 Tax=Janthinobacterium lividum TaxID=29581 RepID=UPI0008746909|nr:TAXI family TRAP transporter solute-binding subunit [Janthinobacterium lividum]MCC7714754.1 ABC transporter substrate-binding protein [Janthinobacterium lividum]OEZ48801.1 NMT1/THI5 like protein [Janthinobacterium lividum]WQE30046.1 TAXI family TRAP transporter solute-binding subunit [Janthinobacterium lividum]STQ95546.1 TRAP transporter solute receptor, TAXI family [Janthinobacterium lividum]
MSKILAFSRFSVRDFLATAGPTLLLVGAFCALAYWLVDPAPPRQVSLSTGQDNSAYEEFGKKYAATLAKHGIKVTLQPSLGSQENLQRLNSGTTDIAFVQSGSTEHDDAERHGLISLGSLFTEPVWLFMREDKAVTELTQLKGMKINLGPEGTGVPGLFRQLLSVNGVEAKDLTVSDLQNTPATVELLEGRIDGLVFSSAPEAPLIQMLLQTPGIKLFDFSQAEAYTRRLPFLTHVVLPRGIVDLGQNIPAQDYHLIAPTATLVAREDLHPALVDLFVQAAAGIHGGTGWFQQQGQFPSARYTEIPVAPEALKFYKDGAPVLQRYMSFWLANFFDRMWVLVVALGALILPLSRVVPPLYVWRIRSRVYRWYGQLRTVEQALEDVPEAQRAQVYAAQLQRLDQIEEMVNQISIPLSFADGLYGLRSHINFVRKRILTLMGEHPAPEAGEPA